MGPRLCDWKQKKGGKEGEQEKDGGEEEKTFKQVDIM